MLSFAAWHEASADALKMAASFAWSSPSCTEHAGLQGDRSTILGKHDGLSDIGHSADLLGRPELNKAAAKGGPVLQRIGTARADLAQGRYPLTSKWLQWAGARVPVPLNLESC